MTKPYRAALAVLMLLFILPVQKWARLFFVGSNPYLSIIAFPQSVLEMDKNMLWFTASYQALPWWGDVDEPFNRPNESYSSTEQNISFVKEPGDTQSSYFKHYAYMSVIEGQLSIFHKWAKDIKGMLTARYTLDSMYGSAVGNLRVETNTIQYIPFDYSVNHSIHNFYLQGIIGFRIGNNPSGLKLGFGYENTGNLASVFNMNVNGTAITTDRLVWGWSSSPCSHIFGVRHVNGDAWLQSSYSTGPVYQYDIQFGTTFPFAKFGTRFRYITGAQDQFSWKSDNTNTVLDQNFNGEYIKNVWSKKTDDFIYRLYGNFILQRTQAYSINLLLFGGYERYDAYNALAENLEVQTDSRESYTTFVIEANPNVNIFGDKGFSIDLAALIEYSHTRFENLYDRWNSLIGGSKMTYWSTYIYEGAEYWWEDFSYADENFLDFGADVALSIPLYGTKTERLGLTLILFINTKFTFKTKTYGTNYNTSTDVVFDPVSYRDNYKREVWFNSIIGLMYQWERFTLRIEFYEPLIYSLFSSTKVRNLTGVLFEQEKSQAWAVQEGSKIAVTLGYEL
ncbi:MAG: hypothetical protein A2Y33_08095 [Spirochaetes bacterium GWF1_51_8]|nr:MAG: hypothetical protein A2Y33_08095 [Spirochaetes bacterium GWF1_51_8]